MVGLDTPCDVPHSGFISKVEDKERPGGPEMLADGVGLPASALSTGKVGLGHDASGQELGRLVQGGPQIRWTPVAPVAAGSSGYSGSSGKV